MTVSGAVMATMQGRGKWSRPGPTAVAAGRARARAASGVWVQAHGYVIVRGHGAQCRACKEK